MNRFDELVNNHTLIGDDGAVIFQNFEELLFFVEEIRQMERERKTLAELLDSTPDDTVIKEKNS